MDSVLRDLDRERSKMQSDVDNLNRHYEKLAGFVRDYIVSTTIEWAKLIVSHPKAILLVVETTRILDETGYASSNENEPVRFTSLSLANGEIWDQLIRPTHSRAVGGSEYHGLTMADLTNTSGIDAAWEKIEERLTDHHIIIYGADWARQALRSVKQTYLLDDAFCLHNKAKEYYGEFYELSLEKVLTYQGIDKKREELRDSRERVLMLAQVMHNLAGGMTKPTLETSNSDDLDSHPF